MKLVICRGLPGSGKTTWANTLIKMYGGVNLATDDYYMVGENYLWDSKKIPQAHEWNQWRCDQAMRYEIETIVISNTNTTWKQIKPYVSMAMKYGYSIQVVEPPTSWKYDVQECFNNNSHNVPLEAIQRMRDRWKSTESILEKIDKFGEPESITSPSSFSNW